MTRAVLTLARAGLSALAPAGTRARLSIFIYHRVLREPDPIFPAEVCAAKFERQLGWIRRLFNILPLEEAIARLQAGSLPARPACITFDDGYADNAEIALPLLSSHRLTATFFVATGFLDGGRMWNDTIIESVRRARGDVLDLTRLGLGAYGIVTSEARRAAIDALIGAHKYLPQKQRSEQVEAIGEVVGEALPDNMMMRSRQVRDLCAAGMTVGAHTVTHPILARLDTSAARREIAAGHEILEDITGAPVTLFAYPNGKPGEDYAPEHVEMVKSLGYRAAVSTAWGTARQGCDPYQLPRFTPWDKSAARFAIRLLRNVGGRQ
jgi:peptidoglycan/xylan/chitin deacetylase (PgdA/CDA1 family)